MRTLTFAVMTGMLAVTPALAQDKTQEIVGSDAKIVLKTTKTMIDKPLTLPQGDKPEITIMVVTMQPDGHTSLHKHPSPTFGYVMEGAVEVRAESVVKQVKAGEAFMEPIDSPMQLWNTGDAVAKIVVGVIGNEGTPVSVRIK
jgi:quercetin dioxygenase-like cupin family protein